MTRRQVITLLGSAAAAWPVVARAQQPERMRHVSVLMNTSPDEDQQASVAAFLQVLRQLGWTDGRNVRVDPRDSQTRSRVGCSRAGRHPRNRHCSHEAVAAGDPHRADCVQ
jgi:hypothetical protein